MGKNYYVTAFDEKSSLYLQPVSVNVLNPETSEVLVENTFKGYQKHTSVDDIEISKKIAALLKLDENNARKRKLEDFKTTFIWKAQKVELRCKQIAMKVTQKIGLYEVLHRLHNR